MLNELRELYARISITITTLKAPPPTVAPSTTISLSEAAETALISDIRRLVDLVLYGDVKDDDEEQGLFEYFCEKNCLQVSF